MAVRDYRVTIIGGGPAGLAPLLAMHRQGTLDALLDAGVLVLEQSDVLGSGDLGRYAIASDSTGKTFVDCLRSPRETELTALQGHPLAVALAEAGEGPAPLALVGRFMGLVGGTLARMIAAHPACAVLTRHRAVSVRRVRGGWRTVAEDRFGRRSPFGSRDVISATGAHQPASRLATETVGGVGLAESCGDRLMQSGAALTQDGLMEIARRLRHRAAPSVAVVGGSTSAVAVAHALLHRLPEIRFGADGVTILHRRPLRVYYTSVAEALADGYDEFDSNDICPVSKRVFRLAGFRLDSRELVMQARQIGGRAKDERVRLHRLGEDRGATESILRSADLVIAALGYRPRAVPIFGIDGDPIELFAHDRPGAPLVDGGCRVLDRAGAPIEGVYGIGLAAGFVPRGALGGEPSFMGQANGLWLWQNDVGLLIARAVLAEPRADTWPEPAVVVPVGTAPSMALGAD